MQVTGRTAGTQAHPLPTTEALKLAMLMAVVDELGRLIAAGQPPGPDHPVTVTRENLAKGEQMANAPTAP